MTPSPKKGRGCLIKAFSLPELLLATAILAFAISAILLGFITCFFLNDTNRKTTTAISHAQLFMEEIKGYGFSNITNDTMNYTDPDFPPVEPLPNETVTLTVNPVNGTNGSLLDVELRVDWLERGSRSRNLTLQTYIAED